MKRREFIQALATVPVAATSLAQQPPAAVPTPQGRRGGGPGAGGAAAEPAPPLTYGVADDAADAVVKFFSAAQFAALKRLGALLVPPTATAPGADECHAAAFLDFLLSESPADRQTLYRTGLDTVNAQARSRFSKPFGETDATQADALLAPMRRPWTYAPTDQFEVFLRTAHRDLRMATQNSHEYAAATGNNRAQRWLRPLD